MKIEPEKIQENIRQATTLDLLDRCTYYREGMEADALDWIERELQGRGIGASDIEAHAQQLGDRTIAIPEGGAARCSYCERPAIETVSGWHWLWGLIPILPRQFYYCPDHVPSKT